VGAESVLGYLPEVADHRQVQSTLQTLVNSGLLLTPTLVSPVFLSQQDQDAHLMVALEAVQQAATAAELTALWKKLSGGKTKLSSSSSARTGSPLRSSKKTAGSVKDATPSPSSNNTGNGTSKAEVFDAIKRLVMSQRRVDGSRIPVAKMMHAIWLDSYPLLQHRNLKDEILLVVRISDAARELFSRMHRLFYFQAAMPNSSSSSPTSMPASARVKSFQEAMARTVGDIQESPVSKLQDHHSSPDLPVCGDVHLLRDRVPVAPPHERTGNADGPHTDHKRRRCGAGRMGAW
jgi:hypothetical protein